MVGKLRERITFQGITAQNSDGAGGATEVWGNLFERWARIEPVSAYSKMKAESMNHFISHKIIVRFEELTITSDMRILFGSRIFQIKSYKTIEEKDRFIEIMANEGEPT